jgi:hypothetical protein
MFRSIYGTHLLLAAAFSAGCTAKGESTSATGAPAALSVNVVAAT